MDKRSITSAENGRKGGRKKGEATLYAEKLKAKIAELVERDAPEMIAAQIVKAKDGDTPSFKELMDRVLGKAAQGIDMTSNGKELTQLFVEIINGKKGNS